jgi:hypothetical protein
METYAPVVSHDALLACFGVIATDDLRVVQIDVRITFLNSHLIENIHMEPSPGFVVSDHPAVQCHLKKSKSRFQASRASLSGGSEKEIAVSGF